MITCAVAKLSLDWPDERLALSALQVILQAYMAVDQAGEAMHTIAVLQACIALGQACPKGNLMPECYGFFGCPFRSISSAAYPATFSALGVSHAHP